MPPFILLAATSRGQRLIAACCTASAAAGVRAGMTVAHATALLPGGAKIMLRDHAPVEDAAALFALARWAVRFSPTVAPDYPDGLILDVTGCERLYGSDEQLAALVAKSLRALGLNVRIAIAPTIGAAWAMARFALGGPASPRAVGANEATSHDGPVDQDCGASGFPQEKPLCDVSRHILRRPAGTRTLPLCRVVSEDEWPALFERLPIAALRVEQKVVDELAEVGIDHIGQLLDVPRDEIAARFDADVLLRIDQATGEAMEALRPVRHEEPPAVVIRFAGPTTQLEAIEQAVSRLVEMLCEKLLKREAGARRIVLEIERLDENLHPQFAQETLTLSRPSRNARHLWNLLRPRIERLHLGEGVEQLSMTAARTAPLPHEQEQFDGSSDESEGAATARLQEAAGQLVDLLESRLGPAAVLAGEVVETHIPEAAFRLCPASEGGFDWKLQAPGAPSSKQAPSSKNQAPKIQAPGLKSGAWVIGPSLELGRLELGASAPDASQNLKTTSTVTPLPGDRPTVLFEKPEPAKVTLLQPDGPVIGLQWQRLHRIRTAVGPERIGRRWWQFALTRRQPARDYYRLQDEEGLWLWVYRSRFSRRWFVHGVWG